MVPSGWRPTAPVEGETRLLLRASDSATGIDFGNTQRALVAGTVFNDANGDGTFDRGEARCPAGPSSPTRTTTGAVLDAGETSDATDAAGDYALKTCPPGCTRSGGSASGVRQTAPAQSFHAVNVGAGQVAVGKNFGNTTLALVSGTVYDDADADGTRGPREGGVAGGTVWLDLDNDGIGRRRRARGGDRRARATSPSRSPPPSTCCTRCARRWTGAGGGRRRRPARRSCSPPPARSARPILRATRRALLSGTVFDDEDADDAADAAREPPLRDVTVYADDNNNGRPRRGGSSGRYGRRRRLAADLPAGTAVVRAGPPRPLAPTLPALGAAYVRDVTAGDVVTGLDFGSTRRLLAGVVYEDSNGDGRAASGSPAAPASPSSSTPTTTTFWTKAN